MRQHSAELRLPQPAASCQALLTPHQGWAGGGGGDGKCGGKKLLRALPALRRTAAVWRAGGTAWGGLPPAGHSSLLVLHLALAAPLAPLLGVLQTHECSQARRKMKRCTQGTGIQQTSQMVLVFENARPLSAMPVQGCVVFVAPATDSGMLKTRHADCTCCKRVHPLRCIAA